MAGKYHPNVLIVEGDQDKRVIPYLMEANGITWGEKKEAAVVKIKSYGGYQNINTDVISTELKASGLKALGLIVDADEDLNARWDSIRNVCIKSIPSLPEELPESGLIFHTPLGVKFGIWVMPDNQTPGMLETFLKYLIPDESETLWQYVQEVVPIAKNKGAKYIDNHLDKACIYAWLALQNPPGRQLHHAVMEKILDPTHPKAQTFVNWFKTLYNL
ncbi:MAG: DUF3226 domain-containing protein [Microcoleaceae cyanobacterium]